MGGETSIKGLFQGMAGEGVQVLQGIVKSVSPLKIQIVGDDKLIIGPNNICVPRHLTDYDTEVTVQWQTENRSGGGGYAEFASHNHAITGRKVIKIHNALKKEEQVYVLSYSHGKQYYVLDRVG